MIPESVGNVAYVRLRFFFRDFSGVSKGQRVCWNGPEMMLAINQDEISSLGPGNPN